MGTFADVIKSKGLTTQAIAIASRRLEAHTAADVKALEARSVIRRTQKDAKPNKYVEAKIAKPKLGRGVSEQIVIQASKDAVISKRARAKILRAVNELGKKKGGELDMKALFGEVAGRVGKKPEVKKKK